MQRARTLVQTRKLIKNLKPDYVLYEHIFAITLVSDRKPWNDDRQRFMEQFLNYVSEM